MFGAQENPMDTQVAVALVGVAGTLAGVAVSQLFTLLADARRNRRESSVRWDVGQKELAGAILAGALKLERDGWSAAAHLDRDIREERLPGATSLWMAPAQGIPGVIDKIGMEILREAVHLGYQGLEELEVQVETFVIAADARAGRAARDLVERLWEVFGELESFAHFDDAADAVERVRGARDLFANEVRRELGIRGRTTPDPRPRGAEPFDSD